MSWRRGALISGNVRMIRYSHFTMSSRIGGSSRRWTSFEENGKAVFRCSNDVAHPEEIDIERVFSRFYKADSARTHTSTGLGLSIAKGLVERMDGEIRAELEGERFVVEILFDEADVC